MNSIGGKSNTGEGGEEPERFRVLPNGTLEALRHQAGGLGPLRRDDGISRQCRHDADQGRAGRQARRRRPAARPQGRREDRPRAPLDARRRPDLAAAAPRHLFHRGSGAAHLRSEEREPGRRRVGEARRRKSASARWRQASPRRAPITSPSRASRAARALLPSPRSSMRVRRGRSASPRRSRPSC